VRQRDADVVGASRELAVQASVRRRSCGGKLLREMQERDGHIEDAAQVLDEMPIRMMLENARVLL
jgi:hypothetical protein